MVQPDDYTFMLHRPVLDQPSSPIALCVCILNVHVHPLPDVQHSGLCKVIVVAPASMPIRIITSTSVGERLLNLKCGENYYTESDASQDELVGHMASNHVNLFVRPFRGNESPTSSDCECTL